MKSPMTLHRVLVASALLAGLKQGTAHAQATFPERADYLLDYLNANAPNVGQTGGGPNRIGRTGFWFGQGRIARGNTSTGLSYISAAVGDADAEGANAGFSLWPGMDAWYRHNGIFSQALRDKYRDEYVGALYYGGSTPNQRLMGATACYLASEVWGAAAVTANSNAANGHGDPTGKAFINYLLDNLPRYNCEEHNSAQYLTFNLGPFHTLANFAPDPLIRQKARMGFEWLVADAAPSWLNGYACISNTRGRVDAPQNAYNGTTMPGWWLKFGGPTPSNGINLNLHAQYALPDFPGLPPEIMAAATDRSQSYTRRSVAQRYVSGAKNAYFKQTWMTPKYAMWSQVEAEVGLNDDGSIRVNTYDTRYIQDGYQGERWGIAWDDAPSGESVITIKSPTTYRGTTSGISIYEDTLQHEDTLLAVYNIPEPAGQSGNDGSFPNQYVRGNIPNGYLAYLDESSSTGRIFLHYNHVLVSVYLTNAFNNFTGSPGFDVPATKLGCIVETASPAEFPQATAADRLAAFRAQILATTTDKSGINDPAPRLTYTNRKGKTLSLTYGQAGSIDGDPVDYLQWPTLGNPWMFQPPQGNLTLFGPNRKLYYNFNDWTITANHRPTAVAGSPVTANGANPIDIDLSTRVADLETPSNKLRYKVASGANGSVRLLADGRTARFTPAAGFSGTAGFTFTATDAGNDHRHVLHYDFEQANPTAASRISDVTGNARPATLARLGSGTAAGDTSVPAAIATHSTQSLRLTNGNVGSAKFSRRLHPANVHLSNGDWTFATWFRRASHADDDFLFHVGSGDGFGGDGDELQLYCPSQTANIRLQHYSTSNALDLDLSAGGVLADQWNHVALRFKRTSLNTGTVTLFLNGAPVGSLANVTWALKQNVPVTFGGPARSSVLNRDFNGWIDDLVLIRADLTDSEILDLSTSPVVHSGGLSIEQTIQVSTPPLPPAGLTAALQGRDVLLSWLNAGSGITYTVQRATSSAGPFTTLASGLSGASYTDGTAVPGTPYFYRLIATSGAGDGPPSATVAVTLPANDLSLWNSGTMNGWSRAARITFPGYTQTETLANFPVLVAIDSTALPGFAHSQLAFANGADLRFTDATGTTILNHEIDTWNPSGTSYVWVQVPSLTPAASIIAFWGNPAATRSAQPNTIPGLSLWLKADAITSLADGAQVDTWPDSSGNTLTVTRDAGTPVFRTNVLNGQPVVRFTPDGESRFVFPQMTDIRTVFWVVRETSATSGAHFLLGDDDKFHFHRGTNGPIWSTNTSANIRNGTTRLMGQPVNGTTTQLGSGFRLVSVVTTGNVEASRLSRDRSIAGRSWDGDVAEVILYNRALTESEEAMVGNYLAAKYGLSASYPGVLPAYAANGSTWSNGYLGVFHLRETSGQHQSSSPGLAPTRSVSATSQGAAGGIVGTASAFNGTSNFVNLPDLGTAPQTTVEAWVNLAANPASDGAGIVSSNTWTSGIVHFKALSNRAANAAANGNGSVTTPDNALPLGSYTHVAYSVAGSGDNALALYHNGQIADTAKGHASNNLTNLNIAREFNTRYLNGTVDEVRISNVARSAAWLQATHDTIRTPLAFARASHVSTLSPAAAPQLATLPATATGTSTATLNGLLSYTGGNATSVTIHWGTSDGGTNPAAWSNAVPLGTTAVGNFSTPLAGLAPATTYHFRAVATNANGTAWSPDTVTFATRPAAPGGFALTSSLGQVGLQWNPVAGATHYTVKRSATSGGPWQVMLSNITGTTFLDVTATPGTSWFYVVSASGQGGEGPDSAELSITPLAAPAGLSATPGNGSVTLAWTPAAGATGYTVRRSATPGGPYTVVGGPAAASFTDSSAANGTTWFYIVTATSPAAESAPSNEASATPVGSLPAPAGLTATPAGTSATLSWTPVPNARSYTVARSTTPGGPYSNVASGLLAPTFTNGGLINGTTYYYVVRAVSGSVNSPNSAEVSVVPAPTPTTFTTASAGAWSSALWSPSSPVPAFATTIVFNNSGSISSSQNLGGFLFNKLQFTGQGVALAGDLLLFSGTAPAISGANNVAHSVSNPLSTDSLLAVTVPSNVLSLNSPIGGSGGLLKTGAGTLALGASNTYLGDTVLDGGTLRFLAENHALHGLEFGANPGSATPGTLEMNAASASVTGCVVQTNSSTANSLILGSGRSLTIRGDLLLGTYNASSAANCRLNVTGAGTLAVNANSGVVSIGTCNGGAGVVSTLDLSGLQNFQLQYPSEGGQLILGNGSSGSTQTSNLILAAHNLIEVDSIQIAHNQVSNTTQSLRLGSGTNVIRTESISIGTTSSPTGGGRGIGSFRFNGAAGSLVLRDPSGTSGANLFIADNGANGNGFGTFDVTDHPADIKLNLLRMGASSNATARTDTFSFNQGTLDIVSLDVGLAQNGTATRTSQINLGGGTVTLGNGDSENPGLVSLARNATGVLNLTGGTVSSYVNIVESAGTGSATLNLNGATLDLRGNSLVDITTLTLQSGTLRNVAQINGGAAITKTGAGTLTLDGTNTFTCPIAINAGTLNLAATHPLTGAITGAGNLTVSGTLTGNGTISAPTTVTGTLAPRGGNLAFSGSLAFSGGRLGTALASNSAAAGSIGQVTATGNLTTAAPVDLTLDGPAGTVNLTDSFWTSPQSWPLLSAANLAAPFTLGTVSNDPAGRVPAAYGNFTLQQSATTLTLVWTPLTDLEKWRYTNFGNSANSGNGADSADPDNDGVGNLAEYNAGTNPNDAASLPSFVWNSTASGDWTDATRWNLNTAPVSNAATKLEFLTGNTTLPAGPIVAANNNSGSFRLNNLRLAGTGSGTIAVNLTGAPLEFRSAGGTAPEIRLAAFPSGVNYTVANDITLAADTTFNASNSGRFLFTGSISGPGALTRIDRWSTLILAGNNSYEGTTTIPALGSIQIGNDGATGTPGSGPIVNNGTLRIDRAGTLALANAISGTGVLTLDNPAAADTVVLSGQNSFAGNITVNRGTLRLTRSEAAGTGPKSILLQGTDRRLQLSGGTTLASNITLSASTNSGDGAGISNLDGANRIEGPIQISTGNGVLNLSSTTGTLTITGTITAATTGRSLILGGASTAPNTISGGISDGATPAMPLTKQGAGTWILANAHGYTGPTTINGGKLILTGTLASDINAASGTFAPQGTPATTGSLGVGSTGRYEVRPGDTLAVGGSVTLAGQLDLVAPPGLAPGSAFTIVNKTSAGAVAGSFAGLPQGAAFTASGYDWQISYSGGDGNDVVVTIANPPPLTAIESWRQTHFGSPANAGPAADDADPNADGEPNLLEFATGQVPTAATRATTTLRPSGTGFIFTYSRGKTAVAEGYRFIVESSDTLAAPWTPAAAGTKVGESSTLETIEVPIPASPAGRRFTRLRIAAP